MKYQFWNNTRISVVFCWDIFGRLSGIPTLEKRYKYQCWNIKIISQHWEIIILIGKSLEVFLGLPILVYWHNFPTLGNAHFLLENHCSIYFVVPTLVYCNNLPILGTVVIQWKINGIVTILYQLWYNRKIFQHQKVLVLLENHCNIPFIGHTC